MHFFIISFSHKNSSATFRDSLTFKHDSDKEQFLQTIFQTQNVKELLLLSTCNRFELIGVSEHEAISPQKVLEDIATHASTDVNAVKERAEVYVNLGAIHHLFTVASSLDSLVLGETQIVGQMRDAMTLSKSFNMFGPLLHSAFQMAFKCAAQVRNQTNISKNPVSVASVAVSKAKEVANGIAGKSVLIIGVGEMSELAMKYCLSADAEVTLMNRTYENALALAKPYRVQVLPFEELEQRLNGFDIVFSSTSSNTPIITSNMVMCVEKNRYWFDLAIPRDIEMTACDEIALFRVDDLSTIASENIALREDEAKLSFKLIDSWLETFDGWMKRQALEPLIKSIYQRSDDAVNVEINRALQKGFIEEAQTQNVQKLAHQALKRFLHPIVDSIRLHSSTSDEIIDMLYTILHQETTH